MSSFEDYANKYKSAQMERRGGILQVTLHTERQSLRWGFLPHGEFFIRYGAAFEIAARLRHRGQPLHEACHAVIDALAELGGRGGVVAVDRDGDLALPFSTEGMYRGFVRADGLIRTAIWDEPYL